MLAVGRGRFLLPFLLLLLLPYSTQGMDGCGSSGHWRCGELCISDEAQCVCGDETFGHKDYKWCCKGVNCTCGCQKWELLKSGSKYCGRWSPGICSSGVALSLSQSCDGQCNYFTNDRYRNYLTSRSTIGACDNKSVCVNEGGVSQEQGFESTTICRGNPSCAGELSWCSDEARKEEECPDGFVRCLSTSRSQKAENKTKSIYGQCIKRKQWRDGRESNCINRADEDPFQKTSDADSKGKVLSFASLKTCNSTIYRQTGPGQITNPGLECDGRCVEIGYWCKEDNPQWCPELGERVQTNDPVICSNSSFWRTQTCGDLRLVRCRADQSAQCVTKDNWGNEGGEDDGRNAGCSDDSDKYRPIRKLAKTEQPRSCYDQDTNDCPVTVTAAPIVVPILVTAPPVIVVEFPAPPLLEVVTVAAPVLAPPKGWILVMLLLLLLLLLFLL